MWNVGVSLFWAISAGKAFQDKWKCSPWICYYCYSKAPGIQALACLASCSVLLRMLCSFSLESKSSFVPNRLFSCFLLVSSTAFPCKGEQRVVQPVGLTGHHLFNVELCFSLKAKNKCYWRTKQSWKEGLDTWKTRLLCVSQSKEPVHKEVTFLDKH